VTLTAAQAKTWLDRWDRQQETYIPDREERFEVIADVVAANGLQMQRIADLGCGPGSLTARLADRFPQADIVGIDADPLLLGLAIAGYRDRPNLRFISADLREGGWSENVGGSLDAVVSTTALHWLVKDELAAVYHETATLLRQDGIFVDGDHFRTASPRTDRLADAVRDGRAARVGCRGEDWEQWWRATGDAPELAELIGEREARPIPHHVPDVATLEDHTRILQAAGFADVAVVWQHGDDRVLTAVRA
jgi:SAM-dependent methyltransferase